ncbi:MAG TPA: SusD/RagB family nutrient-binding outer membrane lipoprotein [Puia sp.]|nr:SusD/RagB family nutrient-binding outer membrane lipoprotein [Puia sp.]
MKKNKITFIIVAATILAGTGCKKFLDVNKNPNNPTSVSESLILTPVEVTTGTQVVGGFYGTTSAYWMQQLSLNQPPPNEETYRILPVDVDNTWSFYLYPNTFENLDVMINQAEAAGHNQYAAIGKTIFAYNLAITTDLWGSVPFSQALQVTKYVAPKYDNQEAIYQGIQNMLDSALYYIGQPTSAVAPGSDDFIYNGDMGQWKKFIYVLKARYYLRLTKAPGHTAALQADSALAALQTGFGANKDNAAVHYFGSAQAETPWYENTLPGAGGVVLAKSFIDSLISRNDPRLPILADTGANGDYEGRPSGADASPDPTVFSSVNTFYGGYLPLENITTGTAAPLYLTTYAEQLFIQAEATFYKSGAAAAQPIYQAAIGAHMDMLGISTTAKAVYIASRPLLTATNAIQQIITEKYVADFLSPETYNDWRRTGFPSLTLAQNAYVNYIPRRWPYSSTEILSNPQPEQQGVTTASRVWWDAQ